MRNEAGAQVFEASLFLTAGAARDLDAGQRGSRCGIWTTFSDPGSSKAMANRRKEAISTINSSIERSGNPVFTFCLTLAVSS
ncbi:hypothetical protein NKI51_05970 [Mesorhizobium australicum]|uniref:hypothetical protein n=1 Tax=Mesorhizobium australicum TaxID=536018 RepID=UPI003335BB27